MQIHLSNFQEGKYDEAIFYYNESLKLEPDYITALQGKAAVLCAQGMIN